jgi:hypothetical protein
LARLFNPFSSLPFLILFTGWDRLRAMLGFRTSAVLVLAVKQRGMHGEPLPARRRPA